MLVLILILVFSSVVLGVMSLYLIVARPANTINARLESMDPSLALVENNPLTVMAERVAEPINRLVPISAVEAAKLQKLLLQAGFRSTDAATAFRAIQITLMVAFPTLISVICFVLERPLNNFIIWGI